MPARKRGNHRLHVEDRVAPALGRRAVRRHARGAHAPAQHALVRHDGLQVGGLAHDHRVHRGAALGQRPRPAHRDLLVHGPRQPDVDRKPRVRGGAFQDAQHRGQRALGIGRAPPIQPPALDARIQGVRHRRQPNRVQVTLEHQRAPATAVDAGQQVRTARLDLVLLDLGAHAARGFRHVVRHCLLARTSGQAGVDAVDRHQIGQARNQGGHGRILSGWGAEV